MALRHVRTDDPSNASIHSRTRLLERLLIQHADEGIDSIELRRHMGKAGYVPTPHRWENDGDGDDLSDDEGTILLIGGVAPGDLATEIVDAARQHIEETGENRSYRVVAYRSRPDDIDGEPEEAFRFGLPVTMFASPFDDNESKGPSDRDDMLITVCHQYSRQNEVQFRMLMDTARQYPVLLGKVTELMEQLGGGRQPPHADDSLADYRNVDAGSDTSYRFGGWSYALWLAAGDPDPSSLGPRGGHPAPAARRVVVTVATGEAPQRRGRDLLYAVWARSRDLLVHFARDLRSRSPVITTESPIDLNGVGVAPARGSSVLDPRCS